MKPPFQNLLASVDRRKVPREPRGVSATALEREFAQSWDHPMPFSCRWAARGLPCDCLQCAQDKARAQ